MISQGRPSETIKEILEITTEAQIASYYLGIVEIPSVISSPLRQDTNPSLGIYSPDGVMVKYIDFSNKDTGDIFNLLNKMWNTSLNETCRRIKNDFFRFNGSIDIQKSMPSVCSVSKIKSDSDLRCKVREWMEHDVEYWSSYGISLEWLKYAEVYPISHKIIIKNGIKYVYGADKYAYAFIERKEGKVTMKIYQPYNKTGHKWANSMNRSVWSLWTKIPKYGDNLIITSSLKDCLNLSCNLGIPAICPQGEGYIPKESTINELKSRFKNIIVFFDNDFNSDYNTGRENSIKLAEEFNLKRIEIPKEYGCKDPSDLFKKYGKQKYLEIMNILLKDLLWKRNGET